MVMTKYEKVDGWGPWRLIGTSLVADAPYSYNIDLCTCDRSAQVLDWIFQINGKGWAGPHVITSLLNALRDVLRPQSNLCSSGRDKLLDAAKLDALIKEAARRT